MLKAKFYKDSLKTKEEKLKVFKLRLKNLLQQEMHTIKI
jgi:hypothetical protein